ncbi:MAG: DMT family transporter [Campylobacter sp.]|nr:DMT family transporter [Campylobacter sp.]
MLIACFMFAITGLFAKILGQLLPSIEVVFFRNLVGLFMVTYAILKFKEKFRGGHFWLLMFRGFIGTIAMFAFFYNIAKIDLATAFTFSKTSPIFVAIISAFVFKEVLSFRGWLAIVLGFLGILFIIQPNIAVHKTDIIGVFSGFGAALAYTSIRELKKSYTTNIIVFVFMCWGTALPIFFGILANFVVYEPLDFLLDKFLMPTGLSWLYIAIMGVSGLFFQIYLTKSYAVAKKAGVVAAVSYMDVIFTLIIGYFMGDALPNLFAFFGIILVILSGILVAREK